MENYKPIQELIEENRELRERLWEAEETLRAIQSGEVDALVIHTPDGEQLYTLTGADHGYRVLIESITEGALILSSDDSIYYCNRTLGEMLGLPIQQIISRKLDLYFAPECRSELLELVKESRTAGVAKGELLMRRNDGTLLPVNVSLSSLHVEDFHGVCAVITDLSEQKRIEEELRRHRTELEMLVKERTADLQREIIERKRAEEDMRGQREWLRVTLTGIGDAVIATDAAARITFINPIAAELTGWGEEEARGKLIDEVFTVINEKTRKPSEDVVRRALVEGRIALLSNNTALVTRDGREIPVEDSAAPIRDAAGNIIGVVLVFHDVSEKRRNLNALHESEARYRSLFENNLDAVFLTIPDGRIKAANPAACALFQMTEEEIRLAGRDGLIDPSDSRHQTAVEERNQSEKNHQRELRYKRKDGSTFPAEVSSVILEDKSKAFVILRDITERKRAEDTLQKSELHLARSQQLAHLGSWSWEIAEDRLYWSDETYRLLGMQPQEFEPRYEDFLSSIHPEDRDGVEKAVQESLLSGNFNPEFRIIQKSGGVRYVHSNGEVTFDKDGNPVKMEGYVQDITERKLAEARLTSDLSALTLMHELSGRLLETGRLEPLLEEIMEAAVEIVGADMGTLQLLEGDSLRIVAAHGHKQAFLDFFASAGEQASVCGESTRRGERVVVPDVESSPIFVGTPSIPVMREAGVRAVQSTPMMSRSGTLLGILTTQWKTPYIPDEHDLWRIDLLARQATDLIEHSRSEREIFAAHQRLQALMNALPVGVSFSDDPTCHNITGNPTVLAQFEVGYEDNLSASVADPDAPGRQVRFFKDGREICDTELPLQRAVAENREIPPMELRCNATLR